MSPTTIDDVTPEERAHALEALRDLGYVDLADYIEERTEGLVGPPESEGAYGLLEAVAAGELDAADALGRLNR